MAQNKVKFFVTGATGYVGGSVLAQFLKHPKRDSIEYTALVRSPEKAEKLKAFGVKSVIGSLSDEHLLTEQASQADVVLSLASADHLQSLKAILRGQKMQHEKTGVPPILIHTVWLAVRIRSIFRSSPWHATDEVYSDLDIEKLEKLPPTALHRVVDLAVIEGDEEGYVKTYMIYPVTIWGIANHELAKAGIANWHSMQIPALILASLDRKRAGIVGDGKNVWNNVYFWELAILYSTLYDAIETKHEKATHGREGRYFAENGEHTMYQVAKAIQQALMELGISTETEPSPFTDEELQKYFGGDYLGVNARCKGDRSRLIGWKPQKTTKDFLASIRTEVEVLMKKPGLVVSLH